MSGLDENKASMKFRKIPSGNILSKNILETAMIHSKFQKSSSDIENSPKITPKIPKEANMTNVLKKKISNKISTTASLSHQYLSSNKTVHSVSEADKKV